MSYSRPTDSDKLKQEVKLYALQLSLFGSQIFEHKVGGSFHLYYTFEHIWNKKNASKVPPVGEVVVWPLDLAAVLPDQIVVIRFF